MATGEQKTTLTSPKTLQLQFGLFCLEIQWMMTQA